MRERGREENENGKARRDEWSKTVTRKAEIRLKRRGRGRKKRKEQNGEEIRRRERTGKMRKMRIEAKYDRCSPVDCLVISKRLMRTPTNVAHESDSIFVSASICLPLSPIPSLSVCVFVTTSSSALTLVPSQFCCLS